MTPEQSPNLGELIQKALADGSIKVPPGALPLWTAHTLDDTTPPWVCAACNALCNFHWPTCGYCGEPHAKA